MTPLVYLKLAFIFLAIQSLYKLYVLIKMESKDKGGKRILTSIRFLEFGNLVLVVGLATFTNRYLTLLLNKIIELGG